MESFDRLPVGCVVNGHFLAVHGGISPALENCSDFNVIERIQEPPQFGALCDLLWADPLEGAAGDELTWKPNLARNCSYYFGA